jgi:oxygen-independent coproporphyrinogen-3 oxidase
MAKGLYLHLPFCRTICTYCDFPKLAGAIDQIDGYVDCLIREMDAYPEDFFGLETVYFGGGTPSFLGLPLLSRLFSALEERVDFTRIREFTIEANPQDITFDFVRLIRAHHVNRVSLGVQTSHPRLLQILGRTEERQCVEDAVRTLRAGGIANLNLDFIFGIPTETMAELNEDVEYAVSLKPEHLSFYSLILEERTRLMHDVKKGLIRMIEEETEAEMYEWVMDRLPAAGFTQYEISNFARPGCQSAHNMIYWNVQEYLGLGMGAHSQVGTRRFHNFSTLAPYREAVARTGKGMEAEDSCDLSQETGLMTLRLREGIDLQGFRIRFGTDIFTPYPRLWKNIAEGLLEVESGRLRLTRRGILLMNYVERSFAEVR